MINKVTLIGHLGKDPEVRTLENGAVVARFSVATNENYKDKNGEWQSITEWHNVVAWRNLASRAERDLKKGSLVYVEGKLSTRKWQDQNGNDRYNTDVVALSLRPLDKRENSGSSGAMDSFPSISDELPSTSTQPAANTNTAKPVVEQDDDLPF
ncbi:MAG: single-stranded DNA-binding protein [Saprospiraceae bacterium]|nr:single-stranded DNA-binding protein [Saprospiraceae bacterium]